MVLQFFFLVHNHQFWRVSI